jgi:hypothetical protein
LIYYFRRREKRTKNTLLFSSCNSIDHCAIFCFVRFPAVLLTVNIYVVYIPHCTYNVLCSMWQASSPIRYALWVKNLTRVDNKQPSNPHLSHRMLSSKYSGKNLRRNYRQLTNRIQFKTISHAREMFFLVTSTCLETCHKQRGFVTKLCDV